MTPRTCYAPSKSYANYPAHPALGLKRCNAALNLLNSHLSQHSLRNRCDLRAALHFAGLSIYPSVPLRANVLPAARI